MKIGFIGAGKVGTSFGIYLKLHKQIIHGYYSRSYESAQKAAELTDSKAEKEIEKLVDNSDIIIISTNDNEIPKVCNVLVDEDFLKEGKILIHMSGAASSKILKRVKEKKCYIYSLHPLQAFADVNKAVKDLKDTVFSLEGDEEKMSIIEDILNSTGNNYFKIASEQKEIYHATACVVSNYLVTLIDYGLSLFQAIGINKDEGYKALYPLIEGSIKNIYQLGTAKALTGPIARGDNETITKHITALNKILPDSLKLYNLLGLKTLDLASEEKLKDKEKIIKLENILRGV